MSDCTELDVFFRTTNTNPLQELQGIFYKQWDEVKVFDRYIDNIVGREYLNKYSAVTECDRLNEDQHVAKRGEFY